MAAETRIYKVIHKLDGIQKELKGAVDTRLVRASHPVTAGKHVIKESIVVTVATQDDLIKLLGEGVTVEDAAADPE